MKDIVSVEMMRRADENTISSGVLQFELMERAGRAVFEAVQEFCGWNGKVAIVCGTGNNAGDGYVLADLLRKRNVDVTIFLLKEKFSACGEHYFNICKNENIKNEICSSKTDFCSYDIIVDAILGTGFSGKLDEIVKNVIQEINNSNAKVISIDINSGLNGNTGLADFAIKSDLTVSIGSLKSGLILNQAKDYIGTLVNKDIGIKIKDNPYFLIEKEDVKKIFSKRKNFSNKSDFGYIALVGGCEKYSGAIRLAEMSNSAMRSGAGVVKVATIKSLVSNIMSNVLESTIFPLDEKDGMIKFNKTQFDELIKNTKVVAFGMGIGICEETQKALEYLLMNFSGTLVIDADGLTMFSKMDNGVFEKSKAKIVLTPHLKEFSRLTNLSIDEILKNPIELCKEYASKTKTIVLLKGPATIVSDGENVFISNTGCAGMATAGSGDVLSGILAAVLGSNEPSAFAVASSAYVNGLAGEVAERESCDVCMVASDTANSVKDAILEILKWKWLMKLKQ